MGKINFIDKNGSFRLEGAENYSGLYFPLAGEGLLRSAVTPRLHGDSKLSQNEFVLEPVSIENLHSSTAGRNYWCVLEDGSLWSVCGNSAEALNDRFTKNQDEDVVEAGFMWHKVVRKSSRYALESEVTTFVPLDVNAEVSIIKIRNTGDKAREVEFVAAVPLYGRSADNIRDHRHVTSLLHRIRTTEKSVVVKPTLSFDERGHRRNETCYFAGAVDGDGNAPVSFYPTVDMFIGEGGSHLRPRSLVDASIQGVAAGSEFAGKEVMGGIRFEKKTVAAGEEISFVCFLGAERLEAEAADGNGANFGDAHGNGVTLDQAAAWVKTVEDRFTGDIEAAVELDAVKKYWVEKVNIAYNTGDMDKDGFMKWVSFQPMLRRIFGCSFLPYHDYGKGGRGWRDLWQDCLALLLMDPKNVRTMIIDSFGGVRIDGTNATIIGEKSGEFIADRNNICRVWMDHGLWPFMTTSMYIEQTGDLGILGVKNTYFKDKQTERGTATDEKWTDSIGSNQRDSRGRIHKGTLLEHLLLENLCAFYEVGEHNIIRLRGADWNDALDMAADRGESVAFTCAYAGNLRNLASYILEMKRKRIINTVDIIEEAASLINCEPSIYDDIVKKQAVLRKYLKEVRQTVSGAVVSLDPETVAADLNRKADWIAAQINRNEWVSDSEGNSWINSYYDNSGRAVEGETETGVRMMLTGQVFALMSKLCSNEQADSIVKSAKKYLFDPEIGGYRINTDFGEEKYDLGRMFGFAYGEKENGAVFSHMAVMFANALYKNGRVHEGFECLKALMDSSMNFDKSVMYPGIPEYFNNEGRGLYAYLTGAASWLLMTMVTESFGIKGCKGDLKIEPKLVKEQFDENGQASVSLIFAGKNITVTFENKSGKDYGEYAFEDGMKSMLISRDKLADTPDELFLRLV